MSGVVVKNMSLKLGKTLSITGVPNSDAAHFVINVGNSENDIALHINPRFDAHGDTRAVVCNSYQKGKWCEEHREGGFPFNQGEEFKIRITFTKEQFLVAFPDGSEIHFPNRLGEEKYNYFNFDGDVRIKDFGIN
ncbi:hypothetical protein DPEC_G00307120 [Dallia pectoralis]|uniref:Uncharacterized protein n=1 Tax=Dallia pectoralis TaxID=75939 RepID=A0ACC2FEF8_DALPE|nr:hypothetical protein DPEC_G00307120 [Dallia pectoralis]